VFIGAKMINLEILLAIDTKQTVIIAVVSIWIILTIVVLKSTFTPMREADDEVAGSHLNPKVIEDSKDTVSKILSGEEEAQAKPAPNQHSDETKDEEISDEEISETLVTDVEEETFVEHIEEAPDSVQDDQELETKTWFDSQEDSEPTHQDQEDSDLEQVETNSQLKLDALLHGLNLPYNLHLKSQSNIAEDTRRVYLTQDNKNAEEVGSAFADELERIGYEISPVNFKQAKASRGDTTLMLAIEPAEAGTNNERAIKYPDISEDFVIVEIWMPENPSLN